MPDLSERAARLDAHLDERNLDAVWFAAPNSFAWLTGGSNVVDRDADVGVAAAGYVRDDAAANRETDDARSDEGADDAGSLGSGRGSFRVVTDDIEAERLRDEELPTAFSVEEYPWHAASLAEAVVDRSPASSAADFDVPGFDSLDASALRQPLTADDVEQYRDLGREVATAVESVCRELESDDTEREVATALRVALGARGIEAPVALVGGSERATRYRHYTPTEAALGDYALVSVTAQRNGLYASATRTVAFDPPAWLDERHEQAMRVEADALAATQQVAGEEGTAGDVFAAVQAAYDRVGRPDEWRRHHQGGAAGFAGREWIATPDHDAPVHVPMAYAWNPTVQGAKSEDTVLVTADGFEVLTATGRWPTVDVEVGDVTLPRPAILER